MAEINASQPFVGSHFVDALISATAIAGASGLGVYMGGDGNAVAVVHTVIGTLVGVMLVKPWTHAEATRRARKVLGLERRQS